MSLFGDLIILIDEDNLWHQGANFLFGELGVANDDNFVPFSGQASRCTVHADDAGATCAGDSICFQARAIVEVHNLDLFIGINIRSVPASPGQS